MQGPAVALRCDAREAFGAGGMGGAVVLADLETRLERGAEQVGEVALRELGTNVGPMTGLLEQVGVGIGRQIACGVRASAARVTVRVSGTSSAPSLV